MSKNYKNILIFIIAMMILQIGGLSAWGQTTRHYNNLVLSPSDPLWTPGPDSPDIMEISGTLTIDQNVRMGDEVGIFYNGTLCGTDLISRRDGMFNISVFNSKLVKNGPVAGSVLDVKLWDSVKKEEITSKLQVTILSPEVKNVSNRLIWKLNTPGTPWRMDISYNTLLGITKVEPNQNYADQAKQITITGYNFAAGATVKIGTYQLTSVTFDSATSLRATIPANALSAGTYKITVTVGTMTGTLPNGFTVLAAPVSVTAVTPNNCFINRSQEITITGKNFTAGAQVVIGSTALTSVTYVSSTTLRATVPDNFLSAGTYDVIVTAGGESITLARGFEVMITLATPQIFTLVPTQDYNNKTVSIVIFGSKLFSGSQVKLGSLLLKATGYSDDAIIYAEIPAGTAAGTYPVTVISPTGTEGTFNSYQVLAAPISVTGVDPNHSANNLSQEITIRGSNFPSGATVKIGAKGLTQVSFINSSTLKATVPSGFLPVGTYNLVVASGENTGTLPNGFTVQPGSEERVSLARGLNLISYPVPVPSSSYSSYDFITQYFTPQSLDSLWHYNSQSGQWEIDSWNNGPTGKFMIKNGEGYLVYSKFKQDLVFPGISAPFETNLYKGMNLVSFSPPNGSFTSYDLLQSMVNGPTEVAALQRYENTSGRWYITFFLSGKATGDEFPIKKDESYIVYMKKDKLAWIP